MAARGPGLRRRGMIFALLLLLLLYFDKTFNMRAFVCLVQLRGSALRWY